MPTILSYKLDDHLSNQWVNLFVQLYDSKTQRYEVPVPMPKATSKASDPTYTVKFNKDPFSLKILRKGNDAVL